MYGTDHRFRHYEAQVMKAGMMRQTYKVIAADQVRPMDQLVEVQ
ncbi:hypothetical protein [Sinorhizobium medicae]|nr:hypothetical protein [Sinorhizobium medicae]